MSWRNMPSYTIVPPAHPRLARPQVERIAYLKLVQGKITIEEYREAIAPAPRHRRRWLRGR